MSEEKKPRIDLKARLGKKTVSTSPGAPAIPPPVGLPKPPAGIGGGVPKPPFGSKPASSRPKVDASSPYAAMSAEHAPEPSKPQAIKIEMSEEVVQAQKKGRSKIIALAGATAVVGGLIGYAVGGGVENRKEAKRCPSRQLIKELIKEVDAANAKLEALAEVLKSARDKLKSNKYPEDEVKKLGGINIPFDGAKLTGKGIGRFKPEVVTMLVNFASGSAEANESKDKIRRLLVGSKKQISDFLSQQENPKVRWGVYFENGAYGPWASMQPLPEPFFVKPTEKMAKKLKEEKKNYTWPKEFKIKQRGKEFTLERHTRGDPMPKTGKEPAIVPVNPTTQSAVCPSTVSQGLSRELFRIEAVLRGDKTPGAEKDGLLDTGRAIVDKLKDLGG